MYHPFLAEWDLLGFYDCTCVPSGISFHLNAICAWYGESAWPEGFILCTHFLSSSFAWGYMYFQSFLHLCARLDLVDLNDMYMFSQNGVFLLTIFIDVHLSGICVICTMCTFWPGWDLSDLPDLYIFVEMGSVRSAWSAHAYRWVSMICRNCIMCRICMIYLRLICMICTPGWGMYDLQDLHIFFGRSAWSAECIWSAVFLGDLEDLWNRDTSHLFTACSAGIGSVWGRYFTGVYLRGIGVICTSLRGGICMICRIYDIPEWKLWDFYDLFLNGMRGVRSAGFLWSAGNPNDLQDL